MPNPNKEVSFTNVAAILRPVFPSAVRVAFGKWAIVRFLFADPAVFLIFLRAAVFWRSLAILVLHSK